MRKSAIFLQGVCILIGLGIAYPNFQQGSWLAGGGVLSLFFGFAAMAGGVASNNPNPKSRRIFSQVGVVACFVPLSGAILSVIFSAAQRRAWLDVVIAIIEFSFFVGLMMKIWQKTENSNP